MLIKKIIKSVFIMLLIIHFSCSDNDRKLLPPESQPQAQTSYQLSENISIHFTDPNGENKLENKIASLIDSLHPPSTLDLCLYGLSSEKIITSIENAVFRGVGLRFAGNMDSSLPLDYNEGAYYYGYYRIALALDQAVNIPGKKRTGFPEDTGFADFILTNKTAIMHNKFLIIRNSKSEEILITGSTNLTSSGLNQNNNNTVIIKNSEIAETYTQQFEYLLGLPGHEPVTGIKKHSIDNISIDAVFSPASESPTAADRIISRISESKKSVYFMIFSFTHRQIFEGLIRAFRKDLTVRGILDRSQLSSSKEELLLHSGIPWAIDGNEGYDGSHGGKLHHKCFIIDHTEENALVITGSFNWTENAEKHNDENILFIHSKKAAEIYMNEWEKCMKLAHEQNFPRGDSANYQDILINEVMWMGSKRLTDRPVPDDEFIELKNTTNRKINMSGWIIENASSTGSPLVLDFTIQPGACIIIHRNKKEESAFCTDSSFLFPALSLSNSRIELILKDTDSSIIDCAGNGSPGDNFAGSNGNSVKKSMARKNIPGDGQLRLNWFTTQTQANISRLYDYTSCTFATPGQENMGDTETFSELDIVISEVGWAGTEISHYDEWIELYNNTESDIRLGGWYLTWKQDSNAVIVELIGTIPSNGFFLLERSDDDAVPLINADQLYKGGLANAGEMICLYHYDSIIDKIDMLPGLETPSGWAAGSSSPRISMERINSLNNAGKDNWKNGKGDTEGAANSEMKP